jgi:hypothetical protein
LNANEIFSGVAATVFDNARELIEAPLNSQPGSHCEWCFNADARAPGGFVFHARARGLRRPALILPRRVDHDHDQTAQFGHNCAHEKAIGKKLYEFRSERLLMLKSLLHFPVPD